MGACATHLLSFVLIYCKIHWLAKFWWLQLLPPAPTPLGCKVPGASPAWASSSQQQQLRVTANRTMKRRQQHWLWFGACPALCWLLDLGSCCLWCPSSTWANSRIRQQQDQWAAVPGFAPGLAILGQGQHLGDALGQQKTQEHQWLWKLSN